MKKCFKKNQNGFTLLGILMIMTVIAAISIFLTIELQFKARTQKLSYTAIKMQSILEAMRVYHMVNQRWPTDIYQLSPLYLPESAICSQWPSTGIEPKCKSSDNFTAFKISSSSSEVGDKFVELSLPDSKLAGMLKNMIPNSVKNDKTVTSWITLASVTGNRIKEAGLTWPQNFLDYGHANKDKSGSPVKGGIVTPITFPTCASGYDPLLFAIPFGYNKPWDYPKTDAPTITSTGKFHLYCNGVNDCDWEYRKKSYEHYNTDNGGDRGAWNVWSVTYGIGSTTQKQYVNPFMYFTACVSPDRVWSGDRVGYRNRN